MRGRGLLVAAALAWAGAARAQAPLRECPANDREGLAECVIGPEAVVIAGSPALEPLFKNISAALKKMYGTEIYYLRSQDQCKAARQVVQGTDLNFEVADFLGELSRYGRDCCKVPFFSNIKADMLVSDSAVEDCFGGKLPAGYRDFLGPIVTYSIVVPAGSPQWAITAEEAYFVFGFGSSGYKNQKVDPWTDQLRFVVPGASLGAQAIWAKFLKLPVVAQSGGSEVAASVKGAGVDGVQNVIGMLTDSMVSSDGAIALTSAQALDGSTRRQQVRPLAVQAWKQKRAFYADSTARAFDKRNVRDGRYPFWAPTHMMAKADITGLVLRDRIDNLIGVVQGTSPLPEANIIDAMVAARLVPTCAMKVQRAKESPDTGDLMPYTPPPGTACGCYMDELISRGASGCAACSESKPCLTGKTCSNGFCE